MEFMTRLFLRTRNPNPSSHRIGDSGGGGGDAPTTTYSASSSVGPPVASGDIVEGNYVEALAPTAASSEGERSGRALMETPPTDDFCPICFGGFDIPCRAPCGHWFCGGCLLQYWNFSSALQPCKCPMCLQLITRLMPETSLCNKSDVEVCKVLKNVGEYNRLFVGGFFGLALKLLAFPLYLKRMCRELFNPYRPGLHLHELRLIALFLGILYSFSPFDFLHIGRRNIIDVFDYSAFAVSFTFYLVGLYFRRRRVQNVRELADLHARQD